MNGTCFEVGTSLEFGTHFEVGNIFEVDTSFKFGMHLQLGTSFEVGTHFEVGTYLNAGTSFKVYTHFEARTKSKVCTIFDVGTPSLMMVPALWSVSDLKVIRDIFMLEIANDIKLSSHRFDKKNY